MGRDAGGGPDGAPSGAPSGPLYPDGVWLVELAPVADPSLVGQAVATALNVREVPGQAVSQTLAGALAERRLLLVLDNCEHVLDACASLADTLLRSGPGLQILATSQQALGMAGEVAFRVPSLATPEDDVLAGAGEGPEVVAALEAMQGYGAVRLFIERARFGQPGFALSAQNARDVLTVCRRLDGIPLAIELAAARVAVLSPGQLAERLDDRFRLLTRGNRAAPARHQTLRTLVEWSYGLLTPEERSLFDRLAVFAGGFSLEAAEAVCAGEGLDQADVLPLLSLLVEKSLVNAGEEEDARVRFRLPETLREYARERLDGAGAPGATAGATRAATPASIPTWRKRRSRPWPGPPRGRGWIAWSGSTTTCAPPCAGTWTAGTPGEPCASARPWVASGPCGATSARAGCAWPRPWTSRSPAPPGPWPSQETAAPGRRRAWSGPGPSTAPASWPGARATQRRRAPCWKRASAWPAPWATRERPPTASSTWGWCPSSRATTRRRGRTSRRAGPSSRRRATSTGWPWPCSGWGTWPARKGTWPRHVPSWSAASTSSARPATGAAWPCPLGYLGRVALRLGDPAEARARLEGALAIWEEIGEQWLVASVLDNLAEVARVEGDQAEAEALLHRSLTMWRALGSRGPQTQSALHQLGHVNLTLDRPEQAAALFRESLTRAREQGNKRHMAEALAGLAGVAAVAGDGELAGRRFGAAEALRRAVGAALSPADAIDHRRAEKVARAAVGSSAYSAARRAGENAALDSIMDEALRGSPAGVGS